MPDSYKLERKYLFFFSLIFINLFFFIPFTSAWIAGPGDATCNTISCVLADDTGYLFNNLDFTNTSGFEDGVDNTASGGWWPVNNDDLQNDSNVLGINYTTINRTIDERENDTKYTVTGTLLDLTGTVLSINEGTLTDTK